MSRPRLAPRRKREKQLPLAALLGDKRGMVVGLTATSVLSGFAEAAILATVAQVATVLVNRSSEVQASVGPLHVHTTVWALLGVAGGLAAFRLLLQVPASALPARMAADVQTRLRKDLFGAFTRASWTMQSRDREGHLQEMLTNQVWQATTGTMQASALVTAVLTFAVLVVSALALNLVAAAVVLGAAILLFGVLRPLNTLGGRRARSLSSAQMEFAGAVGEAIRLAEETRVFGVSRVQQKRIDGYIGATRDLFYRTQLLGRLIPNMYQSMIFVIIVGGLTGLYAANAGSLASLGAVVLLLVRAGTYGQQIQSSYQFLRQAMPFIERLEDAQRRYVESAPMHGEIPLAEIRSLAFDSVGYEYTQGRPVLADVSFEVDAGEAIGIVGPSGAGKSTLVQILLQLRTPTEGRYLINSVSGEQFAPSDWHTHVAYVPQEPRLLHASVADNIRYFRDIDDAAVQQAAQLARIHDDVMRWPAGYETIVGPRADAVSGGQQQRICLARALAAQPDVLVLDEPTSALDPRSEALIRESLLALKGSVTLFIVAHRMSTLDVCDRVMVIIDGHLDAFDTTALLQASNSYYRAATSAGAVYPERMAQRSESVEI